MLDCLDVGPTIQRTFPRLFDSLLPGFPHPTPNRDGEVNRYCVSPLPCLMRLDYGSEN